MEMKIATGLLILTLHCLSCSALQCYVCTYDSTTNQDPMCEGPVVDASLLQECSTSTTSCSKTTATLSGLATSVSRGCSSLAVSPGCQSDTVTSTCYCETDRCNSSNTVVVPHLLLFASLVLTIFNFVFA